MISFTHTYLEHLEEFSKGRMLKIKTGRRRKVKKNKKAKNAKSAAQDDDDDFDASIGSDNEAKTQKDGEYDPSKPNDDELGSDDEENNNGQIEDTFHDVEMDEESDQEVNVERQLNFNAEISLLINYDVISRYMSVVN